MGGVAEGSADVVRGRATEGYDFVEDRTRDGRKIRMLNVVDEFTRECLLIRVGRRLGSADVIDVLADPAANPCGVSTREAVYLNDVTQGQEARLCRSSRAVSRS